MQQDYFHHQLSQLKPYEGTTLPGYFYHACVVDGGNSDRVENNASNASSLKPILIVHGGFDSTLEELYTSAAAPALERGYNCFTFEGPGQGGVIRKKRFHLDMIGKK